MVAVLRATPIVVKNPLGSAPAARRTNWSATLEPSISTESAAPSSNSTAFGTSRLNCLPSMVSTITRVPFTVNRCPRLIVKLVSAAPSRSRTTNESAPPRPSISRCSISLIGSVTVGLGSGSLARAMTIWS